MKRDVDEAVERVLAGLRDVEAPAGLEGRVLRAMNAGAASTSGAWGIRPWGWAAAVLVVAVIGWPVMLRVGRKDVAVAARPVVAQVVEELPDRGDVAAAQVKVVRVRPRRVEVAHEVSRRRSRLSESDLRALEDMRAPSRPAPPEPLTAQERRLRRIAVQGTEEQRAALNPVVREARYQEAKAAVMEFFEPPKAKADEQE